MKINYEKPREGDIRDSYADISKAGKVLDYNPVVDLENDLKGLI